VKRARLQGEGAGFDEYVELGTMEATVEEVCAAGM
jgi:hypothetical protein